MRSWWLIPAMLAALAAAGGGTYLALHRTAVAPPAAEQQASLQVQTPRELNLTGLIRAQRIVPVAAPVPGAVDALHVEAGQEVFEGQLLAQIRNEGLNSARDAAAVEAERTQARVTTLESNLIAARLEGSRARAEASKAKGDFERLEKAYQRQAVLHREGATPRLAFEKSEREQQSARAGYDSLEGVAAQAEERVARLQEELETARKLAETKSADLEATRMHMAAAEVHAPVTGVVVSVNRQPGDEVSPEVKDLITIATDLSALEVEVEPPPDLLSRMRPGQTAGVRIAEAEGQPLTGTISEVKQGKVIVRFQSPNAGVRPGLTATVQLHLS